MNLLCSDLKEIINQYSKEFTQIYAQKIPARCQDCHYDTTPEPYTWLNMSSLIKKGEKIFVCEQHIDYDDLESFYFNLTDGCIWCRKCESRFNTRTDFYRTIGQILDSHESPGTRGLKNLGNTCFMNSVLQALSNCSQLKYFCLEYERKIPTLGENNAKQQITEEFIKLIKNIWVKGPAFSPKQFVDSVYNGTDLFIRRQQSDAHEFLMFILNNLNETIVKADEKLIDNIFKGAITNKTTCLHCEGSSINNEDFYDITLPVVDFENEYEIEESNMRSMFKKFKMLFVKNSKKVEIKDCLDANFATFIAGDNDLSNWKYCYNCDQKAPFKKETLFKSIPKSLVLVLKRYSKSSKSSIRVYFPETIDLTNYLEDKEQKAVYNLYGIVEHIGFANMGHYKSYCRNHMDKKWYIFNDSNITEIPFNKILKTQGYIGFYEIESN